MFFKKKLVSTITPSRYSNKAVSFGKNIGFTIVPKVLSDSTYVFHLENQIGDFEVTKISLKCFNTCNYLVKHDLPYDKEKKSFTFRSYQFYNNLNFEFEILANIEYKKVDYVEDTYILHFPSRRLKMLDPYEFEEIEIVLPKYSHLSFICYFKKHEDGNVEVHIVNPYNVKIQGKKGDFIYETDENYDVDLRLNFLLDQASTGNDYKFEAVESRPESVIPKSWSN